MKHDNDTSIQPHTFKPRLFFWLAVLAIPLAVLFRAYLELRSYNQQLESEQQKQQQLSKEIEEKKWLKKQWEQGDPFLIEKEAREELNFVKPGEVVYKLSTTTTAQK
ncbi:MAG: septum formation initiator family protein [bacterium]|nr:septum formation initiator family protein [bacterium]